jgi:acetyl-CoA acetyltransferase
MRITGGFSNIKSSCAQATLTYGVSKMRQAPFIAIELTSQEIAVGRQDSKQGSKKGIFATIFEALHHSRRLQAERTLRQYRHLIDRAERDILRELNKRSGA